MRASGEPYAPASALGLGRAPRDDGAAVHHGGLGTTTATLAAGVPTLVCSVFLDQPFWGARVEELGAGARLPFQRFTAARLLEALEKLLSGPAKARAAELGARMREEHGLRDTASFLEQHAIAKSLSP